MILVNRAVKRHLNIRFVLASRRVLSSRTVQFGNTQRVIKCINFESMCYDMKRIFLID